MSNIMMQQPQLNPQERQQIQQRSKKIFKFIVHGPNFHETQSVPTSGEVTKIAWYSGTHVDQIQLEIKKMCSLHLETTRPSLISISDFNICIYDQDDCVVILSEDMDLEPVYKVKYFQQTPTSNAPNGQNHNYLFQQNNAPTQNQSLLYSPTTMGGTSVLGKSPYMGETYHKYGGHAHNWNQFNNQIQATIKQGDNGGSNQDLMNPTTSQPGSRQNIEEVYPKQMVQQRYNNGIVGTPNPHLRRKININNIDELETGRSGSSNRDMQFMQYQQKQHLKQQLHEQHQNQEVQAQHQQQQPSQIYSNLVNDDNQMRQEEIKQMLESKKNSQQINNSKYVTTMPSFGGIASQYQQSQHIMSRRQLTDQIMTTPSSVAGMNTMTQSTAQFPSQIMTTQSQMRMLHNQFYMMNTNGQVQQAETDENNICDLSESFIQKDAPTSMNAQQNTQFKAFEFKRQDLIRDSIPTLNLGGSHGPAFGPQTQRSTSGVSLLSNFNRRNSGTMNAALQTVNSNGYLQEPFFHNQPQPLKTPQLQSCNQQRADHPLISHINNRLSMAAGLPPATPQSQRQFTNTIQMHQYKAPQENSSNNNVYESIYKNIQKQMLIQQQKEINFKNSIAGSTHLNTHNTDDPTPHELQQIYEMQMLHHPQYQQHQYPHRTEPADNFNLHNMQMTQGQCPMRMASNKNRIAHTNMIINRNEITGSNNGQMYQMKRHLYDSKGNENINENKSIRMNNNTLCGLSNINRDESMDNIDIENFEGDQRCSDLNYQIKVSQSDVSASVNNQYVKNISEMNHSRDSASKFHNQNQQTKYCRSSVVQTNTAADHHQNLIMMQQQKMQQERQNAQQVSQHMYHQQQQNKMEACSTPNAQTQGGKRQRLEKNGDGLPPHDQAIRDMQPKSVQMIHQMDRLTLKSDQKQNEFRKLNNLAKKNISEMSNGLTPKSPHAAQNQSQHNGRNLSGKKTSGPLVRVASLKIQDSLLQMVKKSGFKEGFNDTKPANQEEAKQEDIVVKSSRSSSQEAPGGPSASETVHHTKKEQQLAQPQKVDQADHTKKLRGNETATQNEMKFSSPEDQNRKRKSSDRQQASEKSNSQMGNIIFPAYPSGKFYQNNEDVILKQKIEQLEKQKKLNPIEYQDREKEQAQQLLDLSPYSSQNRYRLGNVGSQNVLNQNADKLQKTESKGSGPKDKVASSNDVVAKQANQGFQKTQETRSCNTPQPNQNVKKLTASPLGQAMNKIGLQIGVNTGLNLNKLIQQKPQQIQEEMAKNTQDQAISGHGPNEQNGVNQSKSSPHKDMYNHSMPSGGSDDGKAGSSGCKQPPAEVIGTAEEVIFNSKFTPVRAPNESNSSMRDQHYLEYDGKSLPLTPNQNPKTPIHTKKKEAQQPIKEEAKDISDKVSSSAYKTPIPQARKMTTRKQMPITRSGGRQAEKSEDCSNDDDRSYIAPPLSGRKQENSRSDISDISRPPTRPMPQWDDDKSINQPQTYNSNHRKHETSQSDISNISRSPFLVLKKEPIGQIAGTNFNFDPMQKPKQEPKLKDLKKNCEIFRMGSFQLNNDAIIPDYTEKDFKNTADEQVDEAGDGKFDEEETPSSSRYHSGKQEKENQQYFKQESQSIDGKSSSNGQNKTSKFQDIETEDKATGDDDMNDQEIDEVNFEDNKQENEVLNMPKTPMQAPVTPIMQPKKNFREVERRKREVDDESDNGQGENTFKTPVLQKRKLFKKPQRNSNKTFKESDGKTQQSQAQKQSSTKSGWSDSHSYVPPQTFNSNQRQQENSNSDISNVSKSPFLMPKKEVRGTIAPDGSLVDFNLIEHRRPEQKNDPNLKAIKKAERAEILRQGSFSLNDSAVIPDTDSPCIGYERDNEDEVKAETPFFDNQFGNKEWENIHGSPNKSPVQDSKSANEKTIKKLKGINGNESALTFGAAEGEGQSFKDTDNSYRDISKGSINVSAKDSNPSPIKNLKSKITGENKQNSQQSTFKRLNVKKQEDSAEEDSEVN